MAQEMIYHIKPTSVWGDSYKANNPQRKLRLLNKRNILKEYPFVDHYKLYGYTPLNQRGPTREEQTFLVSYVYVNSFTIEKENDLLKKLIDCGLTYYKSEYTYNNRPAYRVIIMDSEVTIPEILVLLKD